MPKLIEGISDVIAVGRGLGFSIALKSDTSVYAWGNNRDGQIGINNPDMDIVWTPTEIFFEL